jgi:1,2-phenylacetyl-CoA epoxidase catalytic subunit
MIAPRSIRTPQEISDARYREMLVNLLKRQVVAEMGATAMYAKAVQLAPTCRDKVHSAQIAYEESNHVRGVARVLTELGVDVEAYLQTRPEALAGDFARIVNVEIPGWPPDWLEIQTSLFLADRAAVYQLQEYRDNSYAPWAEVMEGVLADEAGEGGHLDAGAEMIEKLCQNPEQRRRLQPLLNLFLPGAVRLMGTPGKAENDYCVAVALKRRGAAEVQHDFFRDLLPVLSRCGLTLPGELGERVELAPEVRALIVRAQALQSGSRSREG